MQVLSDFADQGSNTVPIPPHATVFGEIPNVVAKFFTAVGGVSRNGYETSSGAPGLNCAFGGGDLYESKIENRRRVAAAFGTAAENLLTTSECRMEVKLVDRLWSMDGSRPESEAMVTRRPQTVIGIVAADCAPVLFADLDGTMVAAAHVSWRGAVDGVMEMAVREMTGHGIKRKNIVTAIGPCAGVKRSYAVSPKIVQERARRDPMMKDFLEETDGRIYLYFQAYLEQRLRRIKIGGVTCLPIDTIENPDCYSHSRGNRPSSLMFSGIMLKEAAPTG